MANNPHIGSDFDQFLREQGLLEECSAEALKRVVAWQRGETADVTWLSKAGSDSA